MSLVNMKMIKEPVDLSEFTEEMLISAIILSRESSTI